MEETKKSILYDLMRNGSGVVDFYLGKINGKNIILSSRDKFIVSNNDDKHILDLHALNANLILRDNKIIDNNEEAIVITLVQEAYFDLPRLFTPKIKMGSLAYITYISSEVNIKKTITRKYILNILKDIVIYYSNLIIYKNDNNYYDLFDKEREPMSDDVKKTFMENLKDSNIVLLAHYVFKNI